MGNSDSLIRTKLRLPFIRPSLVARPELEARLIEGLAYPITLVVAPAGFGKTTLIASSLADCQMPAAWLSLDRSDNQAGRFLDYLLASLQSVNPQIGREAVQLMEGVQPAPSEAVLTSLINDLDSVEPMVLVLEDYHLINSPAIHEAIQFLLDHCPHTFHLLLATRSDPPLPLARLRARGQLVELRAADLRFTTAEASQFLNEVMGLALDPSSIALLEERTEGWIAGLQMAALSMRDRPDRHTFIEGFSGTNRHILDYLLGEILASQSAEVQHFLLFTSILERLNASLCDAVLASESDQRDLPSGTLPAHASTTILAYLEQANLFLVPLDDERSWFRYHHLFADLLASQLQHRYPEKIPELHSCASTWYEQNGWLEQAIEHAFTARDLDRVCLLLESRAQKLVFQISFETMQGWINRLPEELVLRKAWIAITQAWIWVATMRIGSLDSWMGKIEANFNSGEKEGCSEYEQRDILANIASLRAYDAFFKGDLRRSAELAHQALLLLNPENAELRTRVLVQLGETHLALQGLETANQYLTQAIEVGLQVGDFQSVTTAGMRLYRALTTLGRLNEAEAMIARGLQALSRSDRAGSPIATKLEQCWGDILRERGQLAEAEAQLSRALEHARQYHSPLDMVTTRIYHSILLFQQADWDKAQKVLKDAESVIQSFTIPSVVIASWSILQARLYLEKGEVELAERYIPDSRREEACIVQSRLLIKKGDFDRAQSLLLQLDQEATAGQRNGSLIQILMLEALVFHANKNEPMALNTLLRCLSLAQPEGYLMVFLGEGEPIYHLLRALRSHPLPQSLTGYIQRLLRAFEQHRQPSISSSQKEPQPNLIGQTKAYPSESLVEPLSQRELEVLQLLALGLTNQEIAQQLVISPGTVKAHTASIYRKLDVANRTEAVNRARQIDLLT